MKNRAQLASEMAASSSEMAASSSEMAASSTRMSKREQKQMGKGGGKCRREANTGETGVSAGSPETMEYHYGDDETQLLSAALNKMEEQICACYGFDFDRKQDRRAMLMGLPVIQGWQVLNASLVTPLQSQNHEEFQITFRQCVRSRWACLKAAFVTYSQKKE